MAAASGECQQGTGMAGRDDAGSYAALYQRRELEQPQRVGHLRARASDAVSQLFMGGTEVLKQLLVGGGLFEGVQLAAVQVFQQSVAEEVVIGGVTDNCGDGFQAGGLYCPPPTLAHDELVGFSTLFS